ncbi:MULTISPECIES: glycosyltransferase family 4 protein [unclassified Arenibacter]|uniref:glycosyltransferase n=1 Tax=unclassified Arenibacter TaxID=2615047 RepID=UPI000E34362C|nr:MULTISPECIES: glycosyltransferase family 4 protein [unclassified Arenibacter]MCM4163161.1 glycosyltransferase [Arenibacter sp. A80]RFT57188.1 glycosyltransferase [Arenibacter sp. P308M17]
MIPEKDKKILIIGYVWPEPATTAAGERMLQLIHFFLNENYWITFACTAAESQFSADLDSLGVRKETILLNHSSFDGLIRDLDPDIVLFDRFMTEEQFGWRVVECAPNAIRILDTEDLHSLRWARQLAYKKRISFTEKFWLDQERTKREVASIYRCDLSLIISLYEMELLVKTVKIDKGLLLYLPMMYEAIDDEKQDNWLQFDQKKNFICIGNGKHAPNINALQTLKMDIWPLIRKELPHVNLFIYGPYMPESIKQLNCPTQGFCIMGHTQDAAEVISQARLNLAPLNFGAGIKGKLLNGMLNGTPSITTEIGAEGICENLPWNGIIANGTEAFAKAAVFLYQTEDKWYLARQNGTAIINSFYNKVVLQKQLRDRIELLAKNLKEHRSGNFMGAMLLHHTMASTKFMSKWISEKNNKS